MLRAVLWRHYGDLVGAPKRGAARAGRVLGAALIGLGIGELLAFRSFSGLWLMLIGWFLITAAAAEEKTAAAKTALAGVRVADVMTPHPELAGGWETVGEFIGRAAARSRQDAFPGSRPWRGLGRGGAGQPVGPASPRATGTGCGWTRWPWLFRLATWPRPMTRPPRRRPAARSAVRLPLLSLTAAG